MAGMESRPTRKIFAQSWFVVRRVSNAPFSFYGFPLAGMKSRLPPSKNEIAVHACAGFAKSKQGRDEGETRIKCYFYTLLYNSSIQFHGL